MSDKNEPPGRGIEINDPYVIAQFDEVARDAELPDL